MSQLTTGQRRIILRRMGLTRDEAAELAAKFKLAPTGDGRKVDSYINSLVHSSADFANVLSATYVEDLQFACGQLNLDATGPKARLIGRLLGHFEGTPEPITEDSRAQHVFIGHGRSETWRRLKDFVESRLCLAVDEFNGEAVAGLTTVARLQEMLDRACFALLVMTAEDVHGDGTLHARENVVHEAGLFQGRLGFHRAILLVEDGCSEFSNISGLNTIRFPKGEVLAHSEDLRGLFEREGLVKRSR